jgi:signal transduction histidine kinase
MTVDICSDLISAKHLVFALQPHDAAPALPTIGPDWTFQPVYTLPGLLSLLRHRTPEAILFDVSFSDCPGAGGLLILQAEAAGVPIVALHGHLRDDEILVLLAKGAHDVLARAALTPANLDRVIRFAIARQKAFEFRTAELLRVQRRQAVELAGRDLRTESLARSRFEVRQQAQLLASILGSLGEAVLVIDQLAAFQVLNPAAQRFFRTAARTHCDDRWLRRVGLYFPDKVTPWAAERLPLLRALNGESADNVEMFLRNSRYPNGLWLNATARPLMGSAGAPRGGVMVLRDVTEQVKAHKTLARREAELHQMRKIDAIGRLAGGVAHDFNNLVTGIVGLSEDLLDTFEAGDPRREEVAEIVRAGHRAFGVTRQLLAFGRRQVIQPRVLEVDALILEVRKLLVRLIGEDIQLRTELLGEARITIDPGQLEQVLVNLVVNARDAMPAGGTITLRSTVTEISEADSRGLFSLAPGPHLLLQVIDTGVGIDPEILPQIFEPFFTTKGRHQGTGLGLATVYGIVKQNHGAIVADSRIGEGTTFSIYFPLAAEDCAVTHPSPAGTSARGDERILVIEDEEIVRIAVSKKLTGQGYRVTTAKNGEEALRMAENQTFDLILSDIIMPGLTGPATVHRLRSRMPLVPVLYMSGYPDDVIAQRGILEPGIEFIEKGAISRQLALKVRQLLDGAAPRHSLTTGGGSGGASAPSSEEAVAESSEGKPSEV